VKSFTNCLTLNRFVVFCFGEKVFFDKLEFLK
jgi:hypothetical protein